MSDAHNDRCASLLGEGCDCRSPWPDDDPPTSDNTGQQDHISNSAAPDTVDMDPRWDDSPLNDHGYDPKYKPVSGRVPDVVAKWGRRSQVRWFNRFPGLLMPSSQWDRFYCSSVEHKGQCCISCMEDAEYEGYPNFDGEHCCCYGYRAATDGT